MSDKTTLTTTVEETMSYEIESERARVQDQEGTVPSRSEVLRRAVRLYVEMDNPEEMI